MPADLEAKAARRQAIVQILRREPVASQQDLVAKLAARGHAATQSSVSRDLRDLGVAWAGGRYQLLAAQPAATPALEAEAGLLRGARPAGPNLTVILTAVGAAQRVAVDLDRCGWPELVGTLAGDDTIFAATATARDQKQLLARLAPFLTER